MLPLAAAWAGLALWPDGCPTPHLHQLPAPCRTPRPLPPAEVAAKKAALEARREERRKAMAELQARKRMLGNIVFVGQLFK